MKLVISCLSVLAILLSFLCPKIKYHRFNNFDPIFDDDKKQKIMKTLTLISLFVKVWTMGYICLSSVPPNIR